MIPLILSESVDAGGQSDFEAMYLRWRDAMYRAALRIVRDPHLAEDVVHDAFLNAAKIFDRLRGEPEAGQRRYLLSTTRYRALNALRERNGRAELPENLPARQEGTLTALEQVIAMLPPRDAEVIRLRYVDGYSVRETAAILRITEEAAQKRAERAKERLKALLIENGFEEYFE